MNQRNYFKCCKNKELNYYCCIACNEIFHKSCGDRRKEIKIIENHKVLCSNECIEKNRNDELQKRRLEELNDIMDNQNKCLKDRDHELMILKDNYDEEVKEKNEIIAMLEKDINERQIHLEKERKFRKSLEYDAEESEQGYMQMIKNQSIKIAKMEDDLTYVNERNRSLEDKINDYENRITVQNEEIEKLKKVNTILTDNNRSMGVEKNTNQIENEGLMIELNARNSKLEEDIATYKCVVAQQDIQVKEQEKTNRSMVERIRILEESANEYKRQQAEKEIMIDELNEENEQSQNRTKSFVKRIEELQSYVRELEEVNRSMIETIRIMENVNIVNKETQPGELMLYKEGTIMSPENSKNKKKKQKKVTNKYIHQKKQDIACDLAGQVRVSQVTVNEEHATNGKQLKGKINFNGNKFVKNCTTNVSSSLGSCSYPVESLVKPDFNSVSDANDCVANKILILCDEKGRKLREVIKNKLKHLGYSKYVIETIIKPGASFEKVIEDLGGLTSKFTINDYVIIVAGTNNFKNKVYPSVKYINSIVKLCTHTNIIFTNISCQENITVKDYIRKFNNRFKNYILKLDSFAQGKVVLVDILDKDGRANFNKTICNRFIHEIIHRKKNGNLLFINAVKSDSDRSVLSYINENDNQCTVVDGINDKSLFIENISSSFLVLTDKPRVPK